MIKPTKKQRRALAHIISGHEKVLIARTTGGQQVKARGGRLDELPDGLTFTIHEGDLSIMQAVNLLVAERVDGFDTAESLWQAIAKAKLVEQLTRKLTFGTIAPLSTIGAYIPGLVQRNKAGGVSLNKDITHLLDERRETTVAEHIANWSKAKPQSDQDVQAVISQGGNFLGIHCPAVMHGGGLAKRH